WPAACLRWGPGIAAPWRARDAPSAGGPAGAGDDLPSAREVGRVDHVAMEGERVYPTRLRLLEGRHQLARPPQLFLGRGEGGVDHLDLRWMNRDLSTEPHGHPVLALATQTGQVRDVRVDGVQRFHAGGRGGDSAHGPRVARDVEVASLAIAHA